MRLYFAHPVNTYDTDLERAILVLIAHCFPGVEVDNPNTPEYQARYNKMKASTGGTHGDHKAMDVFYETIKDDDGCVAMPFLDCRMGLGVAGEVQKTLKYGKTAWLIKPSHELTPEELDAFVTNPLNGAFTICALHPEEIQLLRDHPGDLKDNPPHCVVSHEETRLRTFLQYNGAKRPYAEAHKVKMPAPPDFYALDPKKR